MDHRTLGRSGLEVSPVGLGGLAIGGQFWRTDYDSVPWQTDRSRPFSGGWGAVDDGESIRAIQAGLDLGITLIDTSSSYGCGHSERIIGQAIAGKRTRVVVVTKFGNDIDEDKKIYHGHDVTASSICASCEASLRRLNTDYIDVLLLHWSGYEGEIEPIFQVLDGLIQSGKIRAYGWSSHQVDRMESAISYPGFGVVEFPHSIFQRTPDMLALCELQDIGALIRSPLGMGLLTGKFSSNTTFPPDDIRHGWDLQTGRMRDMLAALNAIRDVLTSNGRTLAQGALAWIWAQSEKAVPIPGFKTEAQVSENARAMEFGPLNEGQVEEIDRLISHQEDHE